jgi:hypothetical protein
MSTLLIVGATIVSNPDKVRDALKLAKETTQDAGDLLAEFGDDVVNTVRDFQKYLRGTQDVSPTATVIIYRHAGGAAPYRGLNTGDAIASFRDMHFQTGWGQWENWNDEVSSVKVQSGIAVAFYQHGGYGGDRLLIIGPAYLPNFADIGWNDTVSSCIIKPAPLVEEFWL